MPISLDGSIRPTPPFSIGIDTGGTHTDLVLAGPGMLRTLKLPTTPLDLNDGIVDGLQQILRDAGVAARDVGRFVYASTFVTNLIVEGRERRLGLIGTDGFRDVLEIGRASRKPDVYDIQWRPPAPLVPRYLRHTVIERMDHRGQVVVALDEASAIAALERLAGLGVESLAVCLMHAYVNPAHERRIGQLALQVCPDMDVSLSCDVVREFREYERTSTTCINAFIKRPIRAHLASLAQRIRAVGIEAPPFIMQGNGGVCSFAAATRLPVSVTHSGVMGGIVGATALALGCGIEDIITLDMGGTSADVSLVSAGKPVLANRSSVGAHPLIVPTLDMVTIGAGGGSIAWAESHSAMRVGPRSAGSVPGPACYGQDGTQATVTDANLYCGRLNAAYFLNGARPLYPQLAQAAMERLGHELGTTPEAAALGIIAIAEAHMANAVKLVSVERGLDPRDFTLVAFGGAGALHAVQLAEALAIERILIPPAPGNLSAMGLICADVRHDLTRTHVADLAALDVPKVQQLYQQLLADAARLLDEDGVSLAQRVFSLSADVRYQGQNYHLNLPVTELDLQQGLRALAVDFHVQHQRVYGYRLVDRSLQLVNTRVTAIGREPPADWPHIRNAAASSEPVASRQVLLASGERVSAPVHRALALPPDFTLSGPAIVEYPGATLYLAPAWSCRFDAMQNAHLQRHPLADTETAVHTAAHTHRDAVHAD
ncbi:MAG: hydantoinase/oxoprolinase family protein [Burkholderiaceae bacterium]